MLVRLHESPAGSLSVGEGVRLQTTRVAAHGLLQPMPSADHDHPGISNLPVQLDKDGELFHVHVFVTSNGSGAGLGEWH